MPDLPPVPAQKSEEIGVLKGMAFAILDVADGSDPKVEALLVISSVALFAIGLMLNQMGVHPGILSHVGTIGLRVVETTAFATGIFFAATAMLRHFLKAIDAGGWIAELTSDKRAILESPKPLLKSLPNVLISTDDSTPLDALFYGQVPSTSSTLIPKKTVFEIAGQEVILYGLYTHVNTEEKLKEALQESTTSDPNALQKILAEQLQTTTCDVALKIGDRLLTYAFNSVMVTTYVEDIHAETSYATQKEENYLVYGAATQALILGAPSTLKYLSQPDFEKEFSIRDTTRKHMLRLQSLARHKGAKEISLIIINLGEPIAPPTPR